MGLLASLIVVAQVNTTIFEKEGGVFENFPELMNNQKGVPVMTMPSFDVQKLLDEDEQRKDKLVPFRFGYGFDVSYTIEDGIWENGENSKTWRLKISSPWAYSINLIFDKLQLSEEAELYLFNINGTMMFGPIKVAQNTKQEADFFQTELIAGDEIIVQLIEPQTVKQQSVFKISKIVHGYTDMFGFLTRGLGSSGSCNNDIACYSSWNTESNAVALVISNGTEACSGALINNTAQNFTPYFLTAFHCIDTNDDRIISNGEITVAQNWAFRFNYKKTTCNGNTVSTYTTFQGSTFRAGWATSDFALMEIGNGLPLEGKTFLGWDRSGSTPSNGTGIHHPSGDVMKISFDNQSFGTSSYYNGTNNMWLLSYDSGVVEHGSSGSPLFDQNKRVVGQLYGNQNYTSSLSYCSQPRAEYGKFDLSWTGGGTNATRLSNWLDPSNNTNVTTLNALLPPIINGSTPICYGTNYNYSATNWQSGYTWASSSNLNISGSGSSVTVSAKNNTSVGGWVSINLGGQELARKDVWVGTPPFTFYTIGTEYPRIHQTAYYSVNTSNIPAAVGASYDWWISPGSQGNHWSMWKYGSAMDVVFNTVGMYTIYVSATNACGTCAYPYEHGVYADYHRGGSSAIAYPNPVDDVLYIDLDALPANVGPQGASPSYDIRLYNMSGNIALQQFAQGGTVRFDVSNLPNGVYHLHIYDGISSTPYTQQIIVQH